MKKNIAILLVIVLTMSLYGCSSSDSSMTTEPTTEPTTKPDTEPTTDPTTEPTAEPTTEPTDGETVPDEPNDIGNGGVEDLPEHPNTEPAPTQPAHKHDYKSKVVNPTCDSKGYTEYTCSCGDSYKSDYKDAKGHDYKSKTVAPTCEGKGYTQYTCNACGKSYKDNEKSATGHNYKTETIAPTQDSKGYDLHTCKNCGKSYKDNYTDKLPAPTEHEHEWVWTEYVGPYACREGYNVYTCACGESYKEGTGDVMDCDWQVDHVVEPTTESEGYTVYKCSVCGKTYKDKLPAQTEPTKPAECTKHEASAEVLAGVTRGETYLVGAWCYCDYHTRFEGATRAEAVAKCEAHIAEHGGKSDTHYMCKIIEYFYYNYPDIFECVHCGKPCAYWDYYDTKGTVREYFKP